MAATVKTCNRCGAEKPLSEFYPRPNGVLGRRAECKFCFMDKSKAYKQSEAGKAVIRTKNRNYEQRYPQKRRAHIETDNAIRRGDLRRAPCEVCGAEKVEGHHDDYRRPLAVRWLCRKHHVEHHQKEKVHAGAV